MSLSRKPRSGFPSATTRAPLFARRLPYPGERRGALTGSILSSMSKVDGYSTEEIASLSARVT
jgi:hypothetical protein